jgi:hypothetical protein
MRMVLRRLSGGRFGLQHLARAKAAVARLQRRGIDIRLETALDGRGRERCSIFVGTKKMLANASPFWAAPWVDGFAAGTKVKE